VPAVVVVAAPNAGVLPKAEPPKAEVPVAAPKAGAAAVAPKAEPAPKAEVAGWAPKAGVDVACAPKAGAGWLVAAVPPNGDPKRPPVAEQKR